MESPQSLTQWLDYISLTHPSEIEMGLERVTKVYQSLQLDKADTRVVIVGGTNGKGSTIALAESGLQSLGYSVGCYTSPHILHFNERVRVNGVDSSDELWVRAFQSVEDARGQTDLTYFEFSTLAALKILFDEALDVVLLEVGLGGRLDAVNVVTPDISVITTVDLDHMDWLGNTREQIGFEKAGILREEVEFIGGENLPHSVIDSANQKRCASIYYGEDFGVNVGEGGRNLRLGNDDEVVIRELNTVLPKNNIFVALQIIISLTNKIHQAPLQSGELDELIKVIEAVSLPGRLEQIDGTNIFLDVGHNAEAAKFLSSFVSSYIAQGVKFDVVYSALGDKDIDSVVREVAPVVEAWHVAQLNSPRAISALELSNKVKKHTKHVTLHSSISEAIKSWMASNGICEGQKLVEGRALLVFGSFFTVEAAKLFLKENV